MCDAGGPNQRVDTIGNLRLWTEPGIPTTGTRIKTHHLVRFFFGFPCPVGFCVGWRSRSGRTVFILFGTCKSNPFPPHDPKTPKTVMQSVMRCGIICGKQGIKS